MQTYARNAILAGALLAGALLAGSTAMANETYIDDLEPHINGGVSATGLFPTQAMENQFTEYLKWVKENGLPMDYAIETSNWVSIPLGDTDG